VQSQTDFKQIPPCLMSDSGVCTGCFGSSRAEFWVVLNTRTKPSKTVGRQLLAVLRASNTKLSFGVGYSESSLMKHWLFFATASKRPKPDDLSEPLPVEVFSGNDALREQH